MTTESVGMRRRAIAMLRAALVGLWILTFAPSTIAGDRPARIGEYFPGQILARGSLNGERACEFAGSTPVTQRDGQWLVMNISSDCVASVGDTWTGSLEDGPPRYRSLANDPVVFGSDLAIDAGTLAVATTCKTAKQLYFTFGFGGAVLDKLTKLWVSLTYCYNSSYVWGTSIAGSTCGGNDLGAWEWVVDECRVWSQSLTQSQTSVWIELRGSYHCDPPANLPCHLSTPDGYFHHLYAKVTAYDGGSSTCTNHWDGFVVLGPEMQILSGCQ